MKANREVFALHQRHHEVDDAVAFVDAINRDDIWMAELGSCLRLAQEPRTNFGSEREFRRKNLDRDRAFEATVFRLVDNAHASSPDFAVEFVSRREDSFDVRSKFWVCRGSDWLGHAVGLTGYDDGSGAGARGAAAGAAAGTVE